MGMAILKDVADATAAVTECILKVLTWATVLGFLAGLFGKVPNLGSPVFWVSVVLALEAFPSWWIVVG